MDGHGSALTRNNLLRHLAQVTEASQSEIASLKQAEQRYRQVLDLTWDWEFWMAPDEKMVYTSPSCERISGYSPTYFESSAHLLGIVHPDDRPTAQAEIDRALAQEIEDGRDLRIVRRDGTTRWIALVYRPILDADGTFAGVRGSIRDVTALKESERERERLLAENTSQRAFLELLFNSITDAVLVLNANGQIVQANPVARAMYGADPGTTTLDLMANRLAIHTPDGKPLAGLEMPAGRALRGETVPRGQLLLTNALGQERVIISAAAPLWHEGSVSGAVVVWHDISELRDAQRHLEEINRQLEEQSEELWEKNEALEDLTRQIEAEQATLRAILDSAPVGIVVSDAQARIVRTNPAADRLYSRPVPFGRDLGTHVQLRLLTPTGTVYDPHDLPLTRSALDGETCTNVEMEIEWPNAERRDLLVSSAPIRDSQGQITGAVGVFRDVTNLKDVEREREQLLAELQVANARLSEQAEEMEVQAEELHAQNEDLIDVTRRLEEERQRLRAANAQLTTQAEEMEVQAEELHAQNEELQHVTGQLDLERSRLQAILEQMPGGVVIAEAPSGKVIIVSRHTEEALRGPYPAPAGPNEYMQYASYYPDGRPYLADDMPLARTIRTGEIITNEEIHWVRGDGTRGVQLASARPIRDRSGTMTAGVVSFFDITERREMEEALREARDELETRVQERTADLARAIDSLRESEARYRVVSELTSDYVYQLRVDEDGFMEGTLATDGFQRLTGFSLDEVSRIENWNLFIHADDLSRAAEFFTRVQTTGRAGAIEIRMLTTAGGIIWTNVFARPRWDEAHGRVTAIEGAVKDVTERVQARRMLEQAVVERTQELSTLLAVSNDVASQLQIDALLNVMADRLKGIVDYTGLIVYRLADDGDELEVLEYRGPVERTEALHARVPLETGAGLDQVIRQRRPLIVADVQGSSPEARAWRQAAHPMQVRLLGAGRSWMGVPLITGNQVIGVLRLSHEEPDRFGAHDAGLALAFASHAAVAMENARLYQKAQVLAAMEERQRLARDLHDAVSQMLFSASLTADVLPKLYRRDPEHGQDLLNELRQLNRGAMAEMRMLLLELRPSALLEADLATLLHHLGEAAAARAHLKVDITATCHVRLPADVQVALYRVAQEAMNNVIKHAQAHSATISLECIPVGEAGEDGQQAVRVELCIVDDGQGFDVALVPPNRLGLGIMAERTARIGGHVLVESQPGEGTTVRVAWERR